MCVYVCVYIYIYIHRYIPMHDGLQGAHEALGSTKR